MLNEAEYKAGTKPNDPDSVLTMTIRLVAPAKVVIGWPSPSNQWINVPNRQYSVLESNNFIAGFGVLASNVAATPPQNSFTNSMTTRDFFRIKVQ